ncbi:MAG: aldo/keto reductase [Anaerolineales bacterium]|jgi:aryl-alcohol dehydrogenase-like predicted oxidoreductase
MERRAFGNTALRVTPLGLGLAALGRPGYINLGHGQDLNENYDVDAMQSHAQAVLDEAWRQGVRYFDAARSYGRAEQFLGSWLRSRQIKPAALAVGSKWGYTYTAGWQVEAEYHEIKEHSLAVLRRQWQETQANLGEYLGLYQIHSATLESGVLENRNVLDELAGLKANGVAIGLTLSGANQAQVLYKALEIQSNGRLLFDSVQATWNLLERSVEPALQTAHDAGLGVIVKEALANGRLTSRNNAPDFAPKRKILEEESFRLGTTIDALSLAVVIHQDWSDVVLSGAANVEHMHANAQAIDVSLDERAEERLLSLVEPAKEYWDKRSSLVWN